MKVYTIKQTSSERRADVEQLALVFWIHLFDVCSMFTGSCKRGINGAWARVGLRVRDQYHGTVSWTWTINGR